MDEITQRQLEILNAIINEFLGEDDSETASSLIVRRYEIDACPATVRSEMARLERLGLLMKPHISSGRVPSSIGIKYYLTHLLNEEVLIEAQKAFIKSQIMKSDDLYEVLSRASEQLSNYTNEPSMCYLDRFSIKNRLGKISKYKELQDWQIMSSFMYLTDDVNHLFKLASKSTEDIFVVVGEDIRYPSLKDFSIVGGKFKGINDDNGLICVISSKRMYYNKVIPIVRLISKILNESLSKWRY